MYSGKPKGLFKHIDFFIVDNIAMYVAYVLVFLILRRSFRFVHSEIDRFTLTLYFIANVLVALGNESYKNVIRRGYFQEFIAAFVHTGLVTLLVIAMLYGTKDAEAMSRLQIGFTFLTYMALAYAGRVGRRKYLQKRGVGKNPSSVLIITTSEHAERAVGAFLEESKQYQLQIAGICIMDKSMIGETICGIPVVADKETVLAYTCRNWIDEVLFNEGHGYQRPDQELINQFLEMGITTHVKMYRRSNENQWDRTIERLGPYMVLTRSAKFITLRQRVAKRTLDILGGLVGTIFTGILFLFIAPIIYIQSPGPIFFTQERIGMNGRHFKMYKFRSMVMNADELKKQYMDQNRVGDGMMFKLDWDPRIIGNKELPDGTRKTGIGEFIRKTSIDEFPQFFNVLKGDMSLVGTRPPTLDEWEKYKLHHRSRMAVKPGITGMWQASGRSNITDFEEVVRMDREYIQTWTFGLDLKLLLKTVKAVLKHEGSM